MRTNGALWILAAIILPSCLVYNEKLIDEAGAGSATASGGDVGIVDGSGGEDVSSGGSGGDIEPGTGGDEPVETGGMSSGGDGATGTGGEPPVESPCTGLCVDDMNHSASGTAWDNPAGSPAKIGLNWLKYDDGTGTWETLTDPLAFMSPRNDHPMSAGTNEKELHIKGSDFSDYGIGVHVNLDASGPKPVNLDAPVAYSGVRFFAKRNGSGFHAFAVSLEDSSSTGGNSHPRSANQFLETDWTEYKIPFADFGPPVVSSAIIAIHFTMDPDDPFLVDFSIDDLSFYE